MGTELEGKNMSEKKLEKYRKTVIPPFDLKYTKPRWPHFKYE